jgi:spiro-SPASM protein
VERDSVFELIKKDINAFDIETEISPVDLRPYRLSLTADCKRNLLLLTRLAGAGLRSAAEAEKIISESPELLRTLPAFFNIQVTGACPQACSLCPWPLYSRDVTARRDFMPKEAFEELLNKIEDFAGDAVIDLSLWGELSLHPQRNELIETVLARPSLSLVVETSGIGWKADELKTLASSVSRAAPKKNHMEPLSWIVSLDAHDPERYREVRGPGFSEAFSTAKTLLELFPEDTYVQALRVKGFEDDIERFYCAWKEEPSAAKRKDAAHIIIQKYDDFAGALPKLQTADLSPVKRRPCWHIQRDMNILLDGRVPFCREDLDALKGGGEVLGNVFSDDLSLIWEKGAALYKEHCKAEYREICARCDEYYTYNF